MTHEAGTAGATSPPPAPTRQHAWHRLGIVLQDARTAEDAMRKAYLWGWNVRKRPLFAADADGLMVEAPDQYATVRDNPFVAGGTDVLGVVGNQYTVMQNEDQAELLDALADESGACFDSAGSLDDGRQVFVTLRLPGHINVGGTDRVDQYLTATNSHDMSSSFTLQATPVRVATASTLNVGFEHNDGRYRMHHKPYASASAVTHVKEILDMTFDYLQAFQESADRMARTTMTQRRFESVILREFGAPKGAALNTQTRAVNTLETMAGLFADERSSLRNTAWAGLSALTQWYDHYSPVRSESPEIARSSRTLRNPAFKNRALAAMLAEVK